MLFLYSCLVAVAVAEQRLEQMPIQNSDREIVLADRWLFGVSADGCECAFRLIDRHKDHFKNEVMTWNQSRYQQWERELAWRKACWSALYDVMEDGRYRWCDNPTQRRIESLYELRTLLGRECFYAGVMPDPLPSYNHR